MTATSASTTGLLHQRRRQRTLVASVAAALALVMTLLALPGAAAAGAGVAQPDQPVLTPVDGDPGPPLALPASVVSDGIYGYHGVNYSLGASQVVKVRLSDRRVMGAATLAGNEQLGLVALTDGTHGYFGTSWQSGELPRLVKVRLADMTRVGSVTLSTTASSVVAAVVDGTYAYVGIGEDLLVCSPVCATPPGQWVKVRLADMQIAGSFTPSAVGSPTAAVSDGTFGYFLHSDPSGPDERWMLKVRLADLVQVDVVSLGHGLRHPLLPAFLPLATDGTHAYLGTKDRLVKVRLADLEPVAEVQRPVDGGMVVSVTTDSTYAYFGTVIPWEVRRVRLADLSDAGSIPFVSGGLAPLPVLTVGTHAFFGLSLSGDTGGATRVPLVPPDGPSCGFVDETSIPVFAREGACLLRVKNVTTINPFEPGGLVTRGQMAAFLWRAAGRPPAPTSCGFTDGASIPSFARQGACWLRSTGVTTNNRFDPGGLVTRGQMAAFLWRAAGKPPAATSCGFTDGASIPSFARQGACWLQAERVTTSRSFEPGRPVTRSQMAAFLHRLATAG